MIDVRRIATIVPVTSALIEDAGYFRDRISLILAGFHGVRCFDCGRRLRCVYTWPAIGDSWLYLGRSCYAKRLDA